MNSTPPIRPQAPALSALLVKASRVIAEVLDGHTPEQLLAGLSDAQRPGVFDLVMATLRDFARGDFLLQRLLKKPLTTPQPPTTRQLRALMLIVLHRLEHRPADAHTTVDQAVEAAKQIAGVRFVGLINAVLRNFLRQQTVLLAAADADEVAAQRHPAWWIKQVRRDHPQNWQAILAAGNSHPPMSLRVNRCRAASADFSKQLTDAGIEFHEQANGALRLERPMPVARVPGFAEGLCSVQDAGAQYAALLLDAHDGMRVLDACAAPGGKTAHLLERTKVKMLALDMDEIRVDRVRENLARLGLSAHVRRVDVRRLDKWWDAIPFERILADVPCSASGVVRRHPDAKWLRRETDVAGFATTQREIIDALWQTLAPGGKMLYVTCSVFAQENSHQIEQFVARHADAIRLPTALPGLSTVELEMQLLPTADHDGFYYALLQKRG